MPGIGRPIGHLSVALLFLTTAAQVSTAQSPPATSTSASFTVLIQGARVGLEQVTVTRSAAGWLIRGTGDLAPPLDLVTTQFEMQYATDWHPIRLAVEGKFRNQLFSMTTIFGLTTATSEVFQGGQRGSTIQPISPRTVVLPNNFLLAYSALAPRLAASAAGTRVPLFIAPDGEFPATIQRITPRRIITPDGAVEVREYDLVVALPAGPAPVQVWIDGQDRLARVVLQATSLVAVREDLSSVLTRVEKIRNAGDEDLFIPAAGFSLGATITKPVPAVDKAPVVILVAGSGPQDRDHMTYGVPLFGQIARGLSEAGYFVVRFDHRGSGQSGGRIENATLADYATDVSNIVTWLRRRRDIDADRISAVGYAEGGAVALIAASREKRIRGVGLLATASTPGADFTLEQQRRLLDQMGIAAADQQGRIAVQQRIVDAVVSGKGWEGIPASLRRQADTPWFKSWLQFDPAAAIRRLDKPILIVHGSVDTEVPAAHADQLEALSRLRKRPDGHTRKVVVPGVNHLLVNASTGSVDEYALLPSLSVAGAVVTAVIEWLAATLPPR